MKIVYTAFVACVLFAGRSAMAGKCSASDVKKIRNLNNRAYRDCLNYKYSSAKGMLDAAAALVDAYRCHQTPEAARTYLLLGVVQYAGFKNRKAARTAWFRALAVWPRAAVPPKLASPAMLRFFRKVKKQFARTPRPVVAPMPAPAESPPARPTKPTSVPPASEDPLEGPSAVPKRVKPEPTPALARRRGTGSSWRYVYMPQDPSRYGLGSPLAWRDFRKGRKLKKAGVVMLVVGSIVAAACGGTAVGLIAAFNKSYAKWVLIGFSGAGGIVAGIGGGLIGRGNSKQRQAGLLIFKTKGSSVSQLTVGVGPAGVAARGSF